MSFSQNQGQGKDVIQWAINQKILSKTRSDELQKDQKKKELAEKLLNKLREFCSLDFSGVNFSSMDIHTVFQGGNEDDEDSFNTAFQELGRFPERCAEAKKAFKDLCELQLEEIAREPSGQVVSQHIENNNALIIDAIDKTKDMIEKSKRISRQSRISTYDEADRKQYGTNVLDVFEASKQLQTAAVNLDGIRYHNKPKMKKAVRAAISVLGIIAGVSASAHFLGRVAGIFAGADTSPMLSAGCKLIEVSWNYGRNQTDIAAIQKVAYNAQDNLNTVRQHGRPSFFSSSPPNNKDNADKTPLPLKKKVG